ncbi:recombinase family protein [Rufibacter soli]
MKALKRHKCLIWSRVSSQQQLENGSLNAQLTLCTEYAKKLGFKIIDHETAFESAKEENKRFRQMMKKLTDGKNKYDALIVLSASRFSRYLPIATNKLMELKAKEIYLHVVRGAITSEDDKGVITLYQEFLKANEENQERKEITIVSRLAKLKQGVTTNKPPIGYIPNPHKGKLDMNHELLPSIVPCPEKAPLIKKAFKLFIQKKSLSEVTDEVNSLGLNLTRKYLGELLRKPIFCGRIVDKTLEDAGIPFIMGKHEKLISVHEFEYAQRLLTKKALKRKKRTPEVDIPLNGILKCYICGKSLTGYMTKGLPYYKCNHGCKLNIPGKEVHSKSLHLLSNLNLNMNHETQISNTVQIMFDEKYSDIIQQKRVKQIELAKLVNRMENLQISKLDGDIDERTYTKIKNQTNASILRLESEIKSIKVPDIKDLHSKVFSLLCNPSSLYQKLEAFDKKRLLETISKEGLIYNKQGKNFERINLTNVYVLTKSSYIVQS